MPAEPERREPCWQDSLDPELVRRLCLPLWRPGVIPMDIARRIVAWVEFMAGRLPLLAEISKRRGKPRELHADQVPIVYGRRLLGTAGEAGATPAADSIGQPRAQTTEKILRISGPAVQQPISLSAAPPHSRENTAPGDPSIPMRVDARPGDSASSERRVLRDEPPPPGHPAIRETATAQVPSAGRASVADKPGTAAHDKPSVEWIAPAARHSHDRPSSPPTAAPPRTAQVPVGVMLENTQPIVQAQRLSSRPAPLAPALPPLPVVQANLRPFAVRAATGASRVDSGTEPLHDVSTVRSRAGEGQTRAPRSSPAEPSASAGAIATPSSPEGATPVVRAIPASPVAAARAVMPSLPERPVVQPQQPASPYGSGVMQPVMAPPPSASAARDAPLFDIPAEARRPSVSTLPHGAGLHPPLIERAVPGPAAPPAHRDIPVDVPGALSGGETRVAPERSRAPVPPPAPQREIDIESLVDQVQRKLLRRLAAERDRKGITR